MSSRRPAPVHPSLRATPRQIMYWTNWRIWGRALLYSFPFMLIIFYCAYKYPEWSKPLLPFPESVWEGDIPRVEWFFENSFIDINAPIDGDKDNRTPLHIAASGNHSEMVNYLLERGAKVDPIDRHGFTPLHYAALKMNPFSADALLRFGAQPDEQDLNGRTSLHLSAIQGDAITAAVLVFNGDARAGIPDRDGRLALEYAKSFHGGAKGKLAKQISGGKDAAEETLLHRHLPRRIEYIPEDEFDELGRRIAPGEKKQRRNTPDRESEDPNERTRARIHASRKLDEFDADHDDDLPVVRPRVVSNANSPSHESHHSHPHSDSDSTVLSSAGESVKKAPRGHFSAREPMAEVENRKQHMKKLEEQREKKKAAAASGVDHGLLDFDDEFEL